MAFYTIGASTIDHAIKNTGRSFQMEQGAQASSCYG
jgi:hypothetical protein